MNKPHIAIAMLPSLVTLGNLACGFLAISIMSEVEFGSADRFMLAGWLIIGGMIFDGLDGRVARLAKMTTEFGAQLDSLADMTTFCVAPALLSGQMVRVLVVPDNPRMAWMVASVFVICGALRLARYNAERIENQESSYRYFTGLPTPAAAGVMAALALAYIHLLDARAINSVEEMRNSGSLWIVKIMPMIAMLCGLLMVSRFQYLHIGYLLFRGRQPFMYLVAFIFVVMIFVSKPEYTLLVLFGGFGLSGPVVTLVNYFRGQLKEEEQTIF